MHSFLNGQNFYSGVVWRSLSCLWQSKGRFDRLLERDIHGTNARVAFERSQAPIRANACLFSVSCVSRNDQKANVNSRSTRVYARNGRIAVAISLGWRKSLYITTYRYRGVHFAVFFLARGMLRNCWIPNPARSRIRFRCRRRNLLSVSDPDRFHFDRQCSFYLISHPGFTIPFHIRDWNIFVTTLSILAYVRLLVTRALSHWWMPPRQDKSTKHRKSSFIDVIGQIF